MRCAGCQAPIALATGQRIGFRDVCERCGADLHACVQCAHHDPGRSPACREPAAEPVRDRAARNLCEWFAPGGAAGPGAAGIDVDEARARLEALFKKSPRG